MANSTSKSGIPNSVAFVVGRLVLKRYLTTHAELNFYGGENKNTSKKQVCRTSFTYRQNRSNHIYWKSICLTGTLNALWISKKKWITSGSTTGKVTFAQYNCCFFYLFMSRLTQLLFICSKSTKETLEKGVEQVQS